MNSVNVSELKADPITQARVNTKGKVTPLSGYIHSACDEFIRISTSRGSQSHIECPRAEVLAAFESDEKSGKIVLIVASDAKVRVISYFSAQELNDKKRCDCNNDAGVAEARPLGSIHPALAQLAAEILLVKGMVGTGPGARELRCAEAHHDSIINGGNVADADFNRALCLAGIEV